MSKEDTIRILAEMISNRCTPNIITELKQNEVFVFGSKPNGHHKSGAAKIALERFGAIYGCSEGYYGQSYAIEIHKHHLDKTAISIQKFIDFARSNKSLRFYVIPVGCGAAGLPESIMAYLFEDAVYLENVFLPQSFISQLSMPISCFRVQGQRYGILQILFQKNSKGPLIDDIHLEVLAFGMHEMLLKNYPNEMDILERLHEIENSVEYMWCNMPKNEQERDVLLGRQDARLFFEKGIDWKYLFLLDSPDDTKLAKEGFVLNTDRDGNHRIAFTNSMAAVAFGHTLKMRDEIESHKRVFRSDILSIDSLGDDFVVLLNNKQVLQLHGDNEIELFKDIDVKSIACGCGGIFALDVNGCVHVDMVNNMNILNGLKTWNNIKQISAGPNMIAGVTQGGKVLLLSTFDLLEPSGIPWTSLNDWSEVVKVFVTKDLDADQSDVVYGITQSGKILIGGRVWFDKYDYYKEMIALRNVTDVIEDEMTTLVRFNDGKIKMCCYHSEMYYEEQLAFIKKHHHINYISMREKFNFVAIDDKNNIHLLYNFQEEDWESWGY